MSESTTDSLTRYAPTPLLEFVGRSLPTPEWAVQGIWPKGAMGIIGGRPKDKKSTLAVELAISLATGTPMFANSHFPSYEYAPVLYVQQENADARVQRDMQSILVARGLGDFHTPFRYDDGEAAWVDFYPHEEFESARFEVLSHAGLKLKNKDDMQWLADYIEAGGFKYVFLDPLYMLAGVDEKASELLIPILDMLTYFQNDLGCAPILTHHMTDKGGGNEAASLLGSTYIHGWYEAALFTRSSDAHFVTIKVDAQRDMGQSSELGIQGLGVGKWSYTAGAQGKKDSVGRSAPLSVKKETNKARLVKLEKEHPDWGNADFCQALDVSLKTLERYRDELGQ
jgi:AAA domain